MRTQFLVRLEYSSCRRFVFAIEHKTNHTIQEFQVNDTVHQYMQGKDIKLFYGWISPCNRLVIEPFRKPEMTVAFKPQGSNA